MIRPRMLNKFSPGIMTAGGPDIDGTGSIIPSIARYLFPFRSLLLSMLVVSVLIVGVYNAVELVRGISDSPTQHSVPELCQWMPGDPTLFYLRTKLGVNYDAGHWFHMSENFMSAHSILRAKNSQEGNSSSIYLAFDAHGFVPALNGVTKLLTVLGVLGRAPRLTQSEAKPLSLHFIRLSPALDSWFPSSATISGSGSQSGHAQDSSYSKGEGRDLKRGALQLGKGFVLSPSLLVEQRSVILSPSILPEERFVGDELLSQSQVLSQWKVKGTCVRLGAAVGGLWPTPQRGHWFPNPGDVSSFRAKIAELCPHPPAVSKGNTHKFKLVIYQRDQSRRLRNEVEVLELLETALPSLGLGSWDVRVLIHAKDRSPCSLAHDLHDADVLLTPHGFQSMLLLFLPRPALLFEVFPYRYYKRGYGPLGREYGVMHAGVMSPPLGWVSRLLLGLVGTGWCMAEKQCRNFARGDNVLLTKHGVNRLVRMVRERLAPAVAATKGPAGILRESLYGVF